MPASIVMIFLLTLCVNLQKSLALTDAEYRELVEQRLENCNDCFQPYPAGLCRTVYNACQAFNQSESEPDSESLFESDFPFESESPSESEFTGSRDDFYDQYEPLLDIMKKESSLKENATKSGYCLSFQKKATENSTLCQIDLGSKVFLVAEFIADVAAQVILNETKATSVDTLLVDIQFDMRPPAEYINDVLIDLNLKGVFVKRINGGLRTSRWGLTRKPASPSTPGPNGYRMWTFLIANDPQKNAKKRLISMAVKAAAAEFGKNVYLDRKAKVWTNRKENLYVVSLKADKCTAFSCF